MAEDVWEEDSTELLSGGAEDSEDSDSSEEGSEETTDDSEGTLEVICEEDSCGTLFSSELVSSVTSVRTSGNAFSPNTVKQQSETSKTRTADTVNKRKKPFFRIWRIPPKKNLKIKIR
ncbi:MAG TPA: hypothetical protein IAA80_09315 [Candidatus Gallacutalibacter pullistercoris]|nr:hypothetical protein [Candidatus Gallacutalibacter pullistercoris]